MGDLVDKDPTELIDKWELVRQLRKAYYDEKPHRKNGWIRGMRHAIGIVVDYHDGEKR